MIGGRPRRRHDDAGASLIVAIAFMVMVGSISAGLIALATGGLNNRTSLDVVRNRQYDADAAIEQSIAAQQSLTACTSASATDSYPALNSIAILVDWTCTTTSTAKTSDGNAYLQRNIVFTACAKPATGTNCTSSPVIIRAQVNFQPASGLVTKTYVQSWDVSS